MPSTKTVWGIDVGQCALKALKLQWRDNKLRPLAFDVIEHAKILSQPDADEQALIRSALSKFLSRNSIKGSTIIISVPGQASFTRFIKLPPVEMRKIPEIVRYEARQQIPFNLEEVVWDYQTISPPAAGPREVEVGIFAMKRDIVADYVSDFLAMRIEPDVVQMAPVALYNFLRYEKKEGSGATICVDVGAENTNLVIAEGDRVWIRNIPLGGNNFTQALCKEFKLPFSKAENLKRHAAESRHARQVFQAMRPVFGDLLTEVQRSIGYYTSLHRDSRVGRVVALGNAFRLAGLTKFLSQNLGVEVEKVETFSSLGDAEALSAPLFRENLLSFGVSFGLAIQGLGLSAIGTSLLPHEILNQKVMRRKRPWLVAAGACVVGAVLCFASDQYRAYYDLQGGPGTPSNAKLKSLVDAKQQESNKHKAAFEEQQKALQEEQQRIARIESLLDHQTYVCDVFRNLMDAWPSDARWSTYDASRDSPPRQSLNYVEMLRLTTHYVPDVREFSEMVVPGAVGGTGTNISVVGADPADGAAANQGVLVNIVGITPRRGGEGQRFVHDSLIESLKKCPRTVHLSTPQGEEVLARVRLTGIFSAQNDYQEYNARRSTKPEAGQTPKPEAAVIDKASDSWFEAQWLVHCGPLKDAQRQRVYLALSQIALTTGTDAQATERLKAALASTWLISVDDLAAIQAEGDAQKWSKEAPAEAAPAAPAAPAP